MEQRDMLNGRRNRDRLAPRISLICPPVRPRFGAVAYPSLRQINWPLRGVRGRDRCYHQSWSEHVLLRCDIIVDLGHPSNLGVGSFEVHVQWPHNHSAGLVELVKGGAEIWSKLIPELDIGHDGGCVLLPVGPGLIATSVGSLVVAVSLPVVSHKG